MKHYLEHYRDVTVRLWGSTALEDFGGGSYTYRDVAAEVMRMHGVFQSLGLAPGDRIAICGRNCCSWAMAFLATATYRAVAVPLLYDFTPESIGNLLCHSGSKVLFTDTRTFESLCTDVLNDLTAVFSLEDGNCIWSRGTSPAMLMKDEGFDREDFHFELGGMDDLAVIDYTSGTTGEPKGVMLSNRSLSSNVAYALVNVPVRYGDRSVSMLPLAHMFALSFELLYCFCGGSRICFLGRIPSPTVLGKLLKEVEPYIFVTVPLVLEKMVRSRVMPALEKPLARFVTRIPLLKQAVYRKIRRGFMAALGGKVRNVIIGGAALNPDVEAILRAARIPYTVGYGMTECGPLISFAGRRDFKPGSCGRELGDACRIKVDSTDPSCIPGEVLVKGDNVMLGYYNNPSATDAVFTPDGWLRTGDLGILGKDGSLYLKGRLKCMILTSSGQNVFPEEIEALVNAFPGVEESLVVSRKGRLVALVYASPAVDLSEELCLESVNRRLPSYSRLAGIEMMREPFVHTPKNSIKRILYQ